MEEAIERFVRYPGTLTSDERAVVACLLETNRIARRLAEFYYAFYAELDAAPSRDPSKRLVAAGRPGMFPSA